MDHKNENYNMFDLIAYRIKFVEHPHAGGWLRCSRATRLLGHSGFLCASFPSAAHAGLVGNTPASPGDPNLKRILSAGQSRGTMQSGLSLPFAALPPGST